MLLSAGNVSRLMVLAGVLTGLSATAISQESGYPLTLENCGHTLTLNAPPERVVTVGQASTEILYTLGLHEHVVGTSNWFSDVAPEFEDIDHNIERIADNFPSFESVVGRRPDLVTADFAFALGPEGAVGRLEQFHSLGINTFLMENECPVLMGRNPEPFELEHLFQSIRSLATLFDVQQRGEELIGEMQDREAEAIALAEQQNVEGLSAVFWISSADLAMDPWVAGTTSSPAWMLSTLGLDNIVQAEEEWPAVGWETIARANPDVIVIAEMTRRRFEADDYRKKLEYLRTDPVTRNMDAVINDRIVVMDAHAMRGATLRALDGLEVLAEALQHLN